MPGVALAVLEQAATAERTLAAALRLAALTGAGRINVLAIRTPPAATILPTEEMLTPREDARLRAAEAARTAALRRLFDPWAASAPAGMLVEWCEVEARAAAALAEWGRRADHIVLARPEADAPEPQRQALHASLFDTGRPVLLVPPDGRADRFGRSVAIAWRDDRRTLKAVLAALRWLGAAERVHVLAGVREGEPPPGLPAVLDEHGIRAELHLLAIGERAFGEALLARARELGADILVLGAYVHHPIHRLVLGGVTRHVLAHADLSLFMRH